MNRIDGIEKSHIPPPRNPNRLPTYIRKQRTRHPQHRPRRLLRTSWPSQRNIRIITTSLLLLIRTTSRSSSPPTIQLLPRNPQRDLRPIRHGNKCPVLLRRSQPGLHEPKCNGIRADSERRSPFFRDGLRQPRYAGFGDGVVGLAATVLHSVS